MHGRWIRFPDGNRIFEEYSMVEPFAKLFGEGRDQILFIRTEGERGPAIQVMFKPHDLRDSSFISLVTRTFEYQDDPRGQEMADEKFALMDEETATKILSDLRAEILAMIS
jgi:hypothetical protein